MDFSAREMSVGIQDFEKLRNEECVYVDKTQYTKLKKTLRLKIKN